LSGTLLLATDLVVGFTRPVLGPLSFELNRGDRLGVWGPPGTGKSALLRAIARGAEVYEGRIHYATGLTLVCQEQRPVRPHRLPMRVDEFIHLAGAHTEGLPARLGALLRQRVDSLTGHQYQILSVWAALGSGADLILLDAPTGTLDALDRALLADLIDRQTRDRGVLIASPDRGFLASACTRVLEVGAWR